MPLSGFRQLGSDVHIRLSMTSNYLLLFHSNRAYSLQILSEVTKS